MKTMYLKLAFFLMILAAFSSCETETTVPIENELLESELINILDFVTIMSDVDYSDITFCGTPQNFELWYTAPESYGDVIIYNNSEHLHIIYRLNRKYADAGWSILTAYLYLGDYDGLPYLENGGIDWYGEGISLIHFEESPSSIKISIPLSEVNSCNGIATKLKLNNPDPEGRMVYPRAFLNIEGNLNYPWLENYEYCIQACD